MAADPLAALDETRISTMISVAPLTAHDIAESEVIS
jgi:hypothetical protein